MTNEERIKADAEAYANGIGDVYRKYASLYGYIAGATAESEFTKKAMSLLKIIVSRFQGAAEMADQDYDKGLMTKCRNLIEQWKGKEVKGAEPTTSKCGMCGHEGFNHYIGNQYYLCEDCMRNPENY